MTAATCTRRSRRRRTRVLDPDRRAWHRAHATTTPDEDGGRGAGAFGRPRAAPWRACGGRRVPAASSGTDARPGRARRAPARRSRGEARRRRRRRPRPPSSAPPSWRRSTSSSARDWSGCARRSCSPPGAGAPRRGCCSRRPGGSLPWTARWPARPTSRRSRRRCSRGASATGPDEREVAEAARASQRPPDPGAADALLDALVTRFTEGYAAAVAPLSRALRAFAEPDGGGADRRWLWLACRLAQDLWDDELWHALATRGVRLARDTGALHLLPNALNHLAALNVHAGAFATAAAQIAEVDAIAQATALPPLKFATGVLAATRGDHAQVQAFAGRPAAGRDRAWRGRGDRRWQRWFAAMAHNATATTSEALADARRACEHEDVMVYGRALVELIEAAVHCGLPDEAAAALERLERAHAGERHRVGARRRGALPRAGQRRRVAATASRSSGSRAAARRSSSRAAGSCTASGCGARTGARTRASCCAPPTRASATWAPRRSPSVPDASSSPPARPCAGSPRTRATP